MVILPSIRRKYMNPRIPHGETVQMSECVVTLASDSVPYTGGARTVGVTVTWNGEALSVNADYTLSFANNVNPGPATVTVTGMGQFSGSVTKTFQIISDAPSPSGDWGQIDIENATPVQTTGTVSSGTVPFCVRGGYVFSGGNDASVYRWTYDDSTREFSTDGAHSNSNGYAGGFCFSRDGMCSYMYIGYLGYKTVYMYSHSSAWDVSEAANHYYDHRLCTPYSQTSKSGWSDTATGIDISPDGTKLYVAMLSGLLHTNFLETPFDVTTASSSSLSTVDLETLAGITHVRGMQIAPDGKRMVLIGANGIVHMFDIGTAWDMSTIDVSSGQMFDTTLGGRTIYGVCLSDDGTKMFVKTGGNPTIYVYNLST